MSRLLLLGILALTVGADAAIAQLQYRAFGDSITFGIADTDPDEVGYPTRLQRTLREAGQEGASVSNHGVPGEETPAGLSRISSVLQMGTDFILIMEGTNDVFKGISTETTAFNLEQMVIRAENDGVIPVLATIIPLRPSAMSTGDFELAKDLRQIALSRGIAFADHFAEYELFPNGFPDLYNVERENDPRGHPNGAGFDVMSQTWADVILGNDTLPPVLGDVVPREGTEQVSPSVTISVILFDHGDGIDNNATRMLLNGVQVTPQRGGSASKSTYTYTPPQPLSGVVTVEMDARDQAQPANTALLRATNFSIEGTTFFKGDINRDGRVDGLDLIELAFSFGKSSGSSRFLPKNDLNNDGRVNGEDLAILAANFGKSSG